MKRLCLLLVCSLAAFAQTKQTFDTVTGPEAAELSAEAQVARYEAAATTRHALYATYFAEAEQAHPLLPHGLLQALAFTATRWEQLQPLPDQDTHLHQPAAVGIMGFYRGESGFADTLGEAAAALGVDAEVLWADPRQNILAGAALLERYLREEGLVDAPLEALVPAIARFSGLPLGTGKAADFARDSHAYDVLLTLDRGHDDSGILLEAQAVDFARAFAPATLQLMQAPLIRIDPANDLIDAPGYRLDPATQTLQQEDEAPAQKSADYPPALWIASPYNWARTTGITDVVIHTTEGSYAGTISWFQNNPSSVSAHYVVRSSDGQVTQMVYESRKAAHVGVHNGYTIGIEHEGYVSSASWYTTALYNASSALTRDICAGNGIATTSAYNGASSSNVVVLSTAYKIKGHQHYSSQTHTDPGIYWDWPRYYGLLNPGSGGTTTVLDTFESSEGHFNTAPAYSGSSVGISTASTADRVSTTVHGGSWSEQIKLVDNTGTSSSWQVRFLSGSGSPGSNTSLQVSGGKVGFWIYSGGTGLTAALGVDDSDGTELSTQKSIPANTWTRLEWRLDDAAQWNAWVGGNGTLTAASVTLDAIWFYRAQTSYDVYLYLDDVTYVR